VREAVVEHGSNFASLVVLSAEVSLKKTPPALVRVPLDYDALTHAACPIGLALRVGPYGGPFSETNEHTTFLTALAADLVHQARARGLTPTELQLDFDCAESKLDGYRVWVEAVRGKVAPVPVILTVLPRWLNQSSFRNLVQSADGFVLQVHSLEQPRDAHSPFTLCDPLAARRAVERAAGFGVPFRVALPTYGYVMAFDAKGQLLGLSAEGPRKNWPATAELKETRADPIGMAELVQEWTVSRPAALRGVVWYRLPVADDILNWQWPTLSAIVAARSPRMSLRAEPRRVEAGLVEINLVNDGELDTSSRLAIEARWSRVGGTRLVAGDGLRGFEIVAGSPSTVRFQIKSQNFRLPAGQQLVVGWLRLSEDREVQVEIVK
jgi:hypothetical protein